MAVNPNQSQPAVNPDRSTTQSTAATVNEQSSATSPKIVIFCLMVLTICMYCNITYANQMNFLLNGKAKHVNTASGSDYNERNWGGGFQYDFGRKTSRWVPFVTVSGFIDSFEKESYYAGGGLLRRYLISKKLDYLHFDAGFVGFTMTRDDINDGQPFIGALPVFSVGTDKVAMNITYVPAVDKRLAELWFMQLKLSSNNFW